MAAVMLGHLPPAAVALMSVPAPALASLPWMGQSAVDGPVCRGWASLPWMGQSAVDGPVCRGWISLPWMVAGIFAHPGYQVFLLEGVPTGRLYQG